MSFIIVMLYSIIGCIALIGSISLIKNGPRYMGLNYVIGIAQLILIITLIFWGNYNIKIRSIEEIILNIIAFILGLIGVANVIIGFCRKWYINIFLGVAQLYLYLILL